VSHRNVHPSHSASDYIDGPKYVDPDRIEQHKERSHRHRPKHDHYTSRHSTEDYISPPPRDDRDDYISQDYDATHQRMNHQIPGAWDSYEEPNVTLRNAPRPSHRAMYASPEDESPNYRPADNSFNGRHDFMRYDDSKAWNQDAYEDTNNIQDNFERVDHAQNARPRYETKRGEPRSHHASIDYDSDLQTCVDSEAQQPFYTSGSDNASLPDDTTQDSLRSSSPICPGHFPSSPDGHYAREQSYAARRYASSSPRLDDSINDYTPSRRSSMSPVAHYDTSSSPYGDSSNVRYRESSESLVAQLRAPSPPNRNLDYARYRQSSESPVAQLRAPSPPNRKSDYTRYRHSSGSPVTRRHASPSSSDNSDYTRHRRSPVAQRRYLSETPSVNAGSDFEIDGAASVVESEMERLRRTGSEAYLSSDAESAAVVVNESDDDDEGDAISDGWDEEDYY
jgi:hypothetical protein